MQISQLNGNQIVMGGEALLDKYYPIGRIYQSTENVSPAAFMGGSWERVQDVFPLFAGTTYAAGSTGGSAEHLHGLNNAIAGIMLNTDRLNYASRNLHAGWTATRTYGQIPTEDVSYGGLDSGAPLIGNTDAMSNMPPYRTFYCRERGT